MLPWTFAQHSIATGVYPQLLVDHADNHPLQVLLDLYQAGLRAYAGTEFKVLMGLS